MRVRRGKMIVRRHIRLNDDSWEKSLIKTRFDNSEASKCDKIYDLIRGSKPKFDRVAEQRSQKDRGFTEEKQAT